VGGAGRRYLIAHGADADEVFASADADGADLIGVPSARAINPISKTNWEGTGVDPDIKAPASEALDVAKKMAEEQIKKAQ
jgi:hypothetical protein